jgi:hypothetical protein
VAEPLTTAEREELRRLLVPVRLAGLVQRLLTQLETTEADIHAILAERDGAVSIATQVSRERDRLRAALGLAVEQLEEVWKTVGWDCLRRTLDEIAALAPADDRAEPEEPDHG